MTDKAESATTAPHGSISRYVNQRCRCSLCRAANVAYLRRAREERAVSLATGRVRKGRRGPEGKDPATIQHGVETTYFNWKCRCDACRAAHAAGEAKRRRRRIEQGGKR